MSTIRICMLLVTLVGVTLSYALYTPGICHDKTEGPVCATSLLMRQEDVIDPLKYIKRISWSHKGVGLSQHQNDHHCYECFHASSPSDCGSITYCPHGKECFATHYTGPDGNTYYHLGCASHGTCTHTADFHPHTHGWHHPYTYEEVLCGHCCTDPGCNRNTCDPSS